jgi:membrane protease YdiL (CAAX protease family)
MSTASIPRDSNPGSAASDLAVVLGTIAVAWVLSRWVIYPALAIPDNAPYILRPITGFLAAWWIVRRRGEGLASLGLRRPDSWMRAILVAIALYAADWFLSTYVTPVIAEWVHPVQRPSFLGYIRGNAAGMVTWVAIGWIVGGLFEETLFRGFLLQRVSTLLGKNAAAVAAAIIAQAILFGALHLYGGTFAFLHAAVFAVTHGVFYIVAGRNLLPLIAVHGTWDMVGIYSVYAS